MKTSQIYSFLASLMFGTLLIVSCSKEVNPPLPHGPVPKESQMNWQKMEYYMFVHFGPNTFTDVEWGDGKEDPKVFNPTALDCRQWAETAKNAGMKGIIITAKHHDGFCLWPSEYSTHTVRESLWKDGKGDVLKELLEACREYDIKFGVYVSPWDRNHPSYGTPEYNQVYANTLAEVYRNYDGANIFEQWFDGANGEGPNGKKQIYDWPLFEGTAYEANPDMILFSDIGPDARWMGNEKGIAGETNWSRLNTQGFGRGHDAPKTQVLNEGEADGEFWIPAETDVSIRPGWFYSPSTDDKVKTVEELVDIYHTSIGRNSNLLLNVPPNREGRISPIDSLRLMEFKKAIDESFAINLAQGATISTSEIRGNSKLFSGNNLLAENYDSYWTTNDETLTAWIEVELKSAETFNCLLLQEYIPLGQRIAKFNVEYWDDASSEWKELAQATTIGYKRILRFPSVETSKIKINIQESLACPILNNLGIYNL
ncbi:alpha-L-fucosidase [Bacteroidales bacterium OttesenSCG-928-A17]|nr:alpha-L-fucosidase [Bacteroidales bacterium OttesenSCG-928-A17]